MSEKRFRILCLERVPDTVLVSVAITVTTLGAWFYFWPQIDLPQSRVEDFLLRLPVSYFLSLVLISYFQSRTKSSILIGFAMVGNLTVSFGFLEGLLAIQYISGPQNTELRMKFCLVVCAFVVQFGYGIYRGFRLRVLDLRDSCNS